MRGTKGQFVISRATALEKSCSALAVATLLGFFQSFGQGGHDFEDVADDAVIGDFEDGRVGIFVDGDDGARALHADNMLNGAADAKREIEFWRDGLAGAANLALHGKPAFIANGARRGNFRAKSFRKRFRLRNVFGSFDAAADGNNERRLSEVDRGFGFLEKLQRLRPNLRCA